jgi:hypothetical protein
MTPTIGSRYLTNTLVVMNFVVQHRGRFKTNVAERCPNIRRLQGKQENEGAWEFWAR